MCSMLVKNIPKIGQYLTQFTKLATWYECKSKDIPRVLTIRHNVHTLVYKGIDTCMHEHNLYKVWWRACTASTARQYHSTSDMSQQGDWKYAEKTNVKQRRELSNQKSRNIHRESKKYTTTFSSYFVEYWPNFQNSVTNLHSLGNLQYGNY